MRWFWGVLLLLLGILILGMNLSWWSAVTVGNILQFWPLLLVLLGILIIFRRFRFGWIVTLIVFLALVLLTYDALRTKVVIRNNTINNSTLQKNEISIDLPQNITSAQLIFKTGASEINISGNSEKLLSGTMESNYFKPSVSTDIQNNIAKVTISTDRISPKIGFGKNTITLNVTDKIPVSFELDAGASSLNLDLAEVNLSGLNINAGASSIDLAIGKISQNNIDAVLSAGASSIKISYPKDLGAKIKTESGLSSRDFENFTKIDNNNYKSQNYDSSSQKINFEIKAGASSIKVSEF